MNFGGSSHTPTRCLYECLEITRDAGDAEIRSAYRKAALKWHPDKNNNNNEATAIFQEIQHAYSVLSDPHERSWYDNHREQIIGGFNQDSDCRTVNIFPYFCSNAFNGYGDDSSGFFSVYTVAFEKIFSNEKNEYTESEYPPTFGNSKSSYEEVLSFYNFWNHFSTRLNFSWEDEFNPNDASSRDIRRQIEKENARNRLQHKKKYSSQICELVEFVKRRDKRLMSEIQRQKELKEQLKLKKKQDAIDKAEIMKQRKKEWQLEKQRQDIENFNIFDNPDFVRLDDLSSDADEKKKKKCNLTEQVIYRCAVCKKDFKSEKQMLNHESSKAHQRKIDELEKQLLLETINDEESIDDEIETNQYSQESNARDAISERQYSTNESKRKDNGEKESSKEVDAFETNDSDGSRDSAILRLKELYIAKSRVVDICSLNDHDEIYASDNMNELRFVSIAVPGPEIEHAETKIAVPESAKKSKRKKGKVEKEDLTKKCSTCKVTFESRTKLFQHLRESKHAAVKI